MIRLLGVKIECYIPTLINIVKQTWRLRPLTSTFIYSRSPTSYRYVFIVHSLSALTFIDFPAQAKLALLEAPEHPLSTPSLLLVKFKSSHEDAKDMSLLDKCVIRSLFYYSVDLYVPSLLPSPGILNPQFISDFTMTHRLRGLGSLLCIQ